MSFSAVLETAIGLIFVFLLLGLIGTALQEAVAAIVKLRGKYLLEGLSRMLADNVKEVWRARNHLLGRTLAAVPGTPAALARPNTGILSTIATFVQGAWDWFRRTVLRLQGGEGSPLFQEIAAHPLISDLGGKTAPSYATAASFVTALTDALRGKAAAVLDQIAAGVDKLPPAALSAADRQTLHGLLSRRSEIGSMTAGERQTLLASIQTNLAKLAQGKPRTDLEALLAKVPAPAPDPITAAFLARIAERTAALPASPAKTALEVLLAKPPTDAIDDPFTTAFLAKLTTEAALLQPSDKAAMEALIANPPPPLDGAAAAASRLLAEISVGIENLPEGDLKRSLRGLLVESLGRLDQFQKKVEAWFDTAMERMSGIYKRFTQYFSLAFGIGIAVALNVDTVQIADYLWTHEDARAAVVDAADAFLERAAERAGAAAAEQDETSPAELDGLRAAVTQAEAALREAQNAADAANPAPGAAAGVTAAAAALTTAQEALATAETTGLDIILDRFRTATAEVNQDLSAFPVPLGRGEDCGLNWWRWLLSGPGGRTAAECEALNVEAARVATLTSQARAAEAAAPVVVLTATELEERTAECATAREKETALPLYCVTPLPARPWGMYLLGWLLTGLAVSLGAPFWFDLLKKFMSIRSAGKAPDEGTPGKPK